MAVISHDSVEGGGVWMNVPLCRWIQSSRAAAECVLGLALAKAVLTAE